VIRLAGLMLVIVGCFALWVCSRDNDVYVGLLGGIDVSAGLLIVLTTWPRKIEHQSDVTASHIFRK
jgi:hypothetical protein